MSKRLAQRRSLVHISNQVGSFRVGRCSQGGVEVPTGGKGGEPKPASAFPPKGKGQQIRCKSEADGQSPDGRERLR